MATSVQKQISLAPMAVTQNSLASAITGAGPWTTFTQPTDGLGHQVNIKNLTANSHAGQTFTITGTDPDGKAQTESGITGPAGNATVTSTKFFKTVTQITVSATIGADTMDVGAAQTIKSQSFDLNALATIGASFFMNQTGTATWSLELTVADPNSVATQAAAPWVAAPAGVTSQTASTTALVAANAGYRAFRYSQASQTGTPTLTLWAVQPA